MKKKFSMQSYYIISFILLLLAEIFIALFVDDAFIRPYGGDILVTVLLCCLVRIFFPDKIKYLPLWVFIFAAGVEVMQYFDFVSLLGLSHIEFFNILMGSVFSIADIVCYGAGCVIFYIAEKHLRSGICKG